MPNEKYHIKATGIDATGTLWILVDGLYYWTGEKFDSVERPDSKPTTRFLSLVGGQDRDLYVTVAGERQFWDKLYRLRSGQLEYVAEYYAETTGPTLHLYVARSGRIYNWGERFLAVLHDEEWLKTELRWDPYGVRILDTGDDVYFLSSRVCRSDTQGKITQLDWPALARDPSDRPYCLPVLWDTNKVLVFLVSMRDVLAFDLRTQEPIAVEPLRTAVRNVAFYDAKNAPDGSVWASAYRESSRKQVFYRILPDGRVEPIQALNAVVEAGHALGNNLRILHAPDGSQWLPLLRAGVVRIQDDQAAVFDWRTGFAPGPVQTILADAAGRILAQVGPAVYVFRPDLPQLPSPELVLWEEFQLGPNAPIIRDSSGNVWTFLANQPRAISRWDGRMWHHLPVPFDPRKASRLVADDRGAVLLLDPPTAIDPDGVRAFKNAAALFQDALNRGASRFACSSQVVGCVPSGADGVWYGFRQHYRVYRAKDLAVDAIRLDNPEAVLRSAQYGVLLRTATGQFFRHEQGQFIDVPPKASVSGRWLLGPQGIQPFEPDLLKTDPDLYVPVRQHGYGRYAVLDAPLDRTSADYVESVSLPGGVERLHPSASYGRWVFGRMGLMGRLIGSRLLSFSSGTGPLFGHSVDDVAEDARGNLWFAADKLFVKKLSEFRLKTGDIPDQAPRMLRVNVSSSLPGIDPSDIRLFWRLDDGAWQGGDSGPVVRIIFPGDGSYRVEIIGVDPQGGCTPQPLKFTITASTSRSPASGVDSSRSDSTSSPD